MLHIFRTPFTKNTSGRLFLSFLRHSDLIKLVTVWTFQIKQYRGCAGLLLQTPPTKDQILGCSTTNPISNSGLFPHWLPLNVVMKSRYCRHIILDSSILKLILKEPKILRFAFYKMDQFFFRHIS